MAAAVAERGRRTRVVELSGTGHMVPLTHPDKLVDAMVEHVRWRSSR
jgi:pimeloyl-ACP methyl ester carboxylesterase